MTVKVVYNCCYGGFGFSNEAKAWLSNRGIDDLDQGYFSSVPRHHPILVECVETFGSKNASGPLANLRVKEISGESYRIDDYDGQESVLEPDDYNWVTVKPGDLESLIESANAKAKKDYKDKKIEKLENIILEMQKEILALKNKSA